MLLYAYINGKISSAENANISVSDLGLLRGYGVFDYLRTYHQKPFLLNDYLERFYNSAKGLHLEIPFNKKKLTELIHELILWGNQKEDVGIRLLITGGNSEDTMTVKKPNFLILIETLTPFPEKYYKEGVKLLTNKFHREIPQIKMTNYINSIRQQDDKKKKNAYDILYIHNNKVLETSRNNFFIFKGKALITAKEGILPGITRKFILSLAKKKFNIEEREIDFKELEEASEAFTTGTTRAIVPVVQVNDLKIGDGKPGKNTKILIEIFNEKISAL